ncbi:hypothetical protein GALMADRAFT_1353290 [Galerina marginata CBS 339.88]|uniref:PH domain-containing protein n=1 Tax=Galerina marginata (strain CBS 339.88) TaxID=685588 RepID=A0A067SDB1_GALM3|nr:hypothetical protein GALMADRAFT_1353290 [Galerina marginata CBS 339.88]
MATYRQAYMFTGEPSAAEDAADWLAALESNMSPHMTSRDSANLFSTRLSRKSPAKRWFNSLPDDIQRRWHLLKPEFESQWMLKDSYRRGSEDGFKKGFVDASEKLGATHEKAVADVLDGAREHCDEAFVSAFELGRASGIEDQTKYQQSLQKSQTDTGTQVDFSPDNDEIFFTPIAVDIPLPLTSEVGSQTSPSIFPTPLPLLNPSLLLSPAPISPTLIPIPFPAPSSPPKLNWADDSASLPIIPLIKTPRDLSSLRSNNKPFGTIRHRNRRHFETARRRPTPPVHVPSLNTNKYIPKSSRRRNVACSSLDTFSIGLGALMTDSAPPPFMLKYAIWAVPSLQLSL